LDIPLIFLFSIIPDGDILVPFLIHRGPTHSIFAAFVVFIPFFVVYKKRAIPYFFALVSHSLIGDFVSGGQIQLFWPVSRDVYGIELGITSQVNIAMEWLTFLASLFLMFYFKDIKSFFDPGCSAVLLSVPTFTVLLPTLLSFPLKVPFLLVPPHIVFTALFLFTLIILAKKMLLDYRFWLHSCFSKIKYLKSFHKK
jgi:hypothetical protein